MTPTGFEPVDANPNATADYVNCQSEALQNPEPGPVWG